MQAYRKHQGRINAIAAHLGCTPLTVRNYMARYDLDPTKSSRQVGYLKAFQVIPHIHDHLDWPITLFAALLGCSLETVRRYITTVTWIIWTPSAPFREHIPFAILTKDQIERLQDFTQPRNFNEFKITIALLRNFELYDDPEKLSKITRIPENKCHNYLKYFFESITDDRKQS